MILVAHSRALRSSLGLVALVAFVALSLASTARAQMPPGAGPMAGGMPDPSAMSGIPRVDPQVPPGRLVVRAIRDDFAHPLVGREVVLAAEGDKPARTARVDETGHATFDGLAAGGLYTARATAFGETLVSQPIQMPTEAGVKVMLVWKPKASALLGEPDGEARADRSLPRGAIDVTVVDEKNAPMPGLPIVLAHAQKDSADAVDEQHATTDAAGHARFTGAVSEADAYSIAVAKEGLAGSSKPFRLDGEAGMRVALRALPLTRDGKDVSIAPRSHLIVEVKDDAVEVFENLVIENAGAVPWDPGEGGLAIPLPDGAQGAQATPGAPPALVVDAKRVVLRGHVPPGETAMPFGFVLPRKGDTVEIAQTLPIPMAQLVAITDHFDGMRVTGTVTDEVERDLGGRKFWLVRGPAIPAGGRIDLRFTGLPRPSTIARDVAVSLAALVALWGLVATVRTRRAEKPAEPPPGEPLAPLSLEDRARLDEERRALVDALARLDAQAPPARDGAARDRLAARLAEIYARLDGTAAPSDGDARPPA